MRAAWLLTSGALAWMATVCSPPPAIGQVSGALTLASDYRLRGLTLSHGQPAANGALAYDAPGGGYADVALIAAEAGPRLLGGVADVGFAKRLASGATLDLGVTDAQFTSTIFGRATGYGEAYVGLSGDVFSSHLSYSPDYYHAGVSTAYFDVDAVLRPAQAWRLTGHVGTLDYLSRFRNAVPHRMHVDWRLAIGRTWRALDFELARTGGGPAPEAFIFSVGCAF